MKNYSEKYPTLANLFIEIEIAEAVELSGGEESFNNLDFFSQRRKCFLARTNLQVPEDEDGYISDEQIFKPKRFKDE